MGKKVKEDKKPPPDDVVWIIENKCMDLFNWSCMHAELMTLTKLLCYCYTLPRLKINCVMNLKLSADRSNWKLDIHFFSFEMFLFKSSFVDKVNNTVQFDNEWNKTNFSLIYICWINWVKYCGIIIVHGGPMFMVFMGHPCPQIYILTNMFLSLFVIFI
jgi:hypothetical protein